MRQNAVLGASLAASFALLTACGSSHYIQRGADLYGEGRYVEADEVFARSEPRVARAALEQRAAYAAYRGATFVALGDLPHAQHWLGVATEIERAHPGTLPAEELDDSLDAEGISVAQAAITCGFDPSRLAEARRTDLAGFIELHIEQGRLLDDVKLEVGIVQAITNYQIGLNVLTEL